MPQRLIVFLLFLAAVATSVYSQETATTATTATTTTTTAEASETSTEEPPPAVTFADSTETREELMRVLRMYPPQVGRVLKLDPTLLTNESYLTTYPALAAYLAQHPEVAKTPAYYLESIWVPNDRPPETAGMRVWRDMMEMLSIVTMMVLFLSVAGWLIRTVIEHRRWSRVSRLQAEVHNKLMDRFTSNEELLAYMQTPGGKRFLESGAITVDPAPRALGTPVNRILWSTQVGVILIMAGVGLQVISRSVDKDIAQPMMALGVLGLTIGLGFLLSAVISFLLSKRLGLIAASDADATSASE